MHIDEDKHCANCDSERKSRIVFKTLKSTQNANNGYEFWNNLFTISVKANGRRVRREFIREMIAKTFTGTYCAMTIPALFGALTVFHKNCG